MMPTAIRIVVMARRRMVRDGICAFLAGRPEFTAVGQTGCLDELAELCVLRGPDAALVDAVELTLPVVAALHRVRLAAPATEIVVTYADAAPGALDAAVRADITALVPCSRGLDAVLRRVSESASPGDRPVPDSRALTEYDMRMVSLMGAGHRVAEMAALMRLGRRTVENHKRRLYLKLGVSNSSHAVSRASALGLIDLPAAGDRRGLPHRGEPGRAPLAVVYGPRAPSTDRVMGTLFLAAIPLVHTRTPAPLSRAHWARWQRGPIAWVLVDPAYDAWAVPPLPGMHIIVVLAEDPDLPTLLDMLVHGVHAVVGLRDIDLLVSVLTAVARGYVVVDATHLEDLAGWLALPHADRPPATPALSTREADILDSIGCGHTIRQTARMLGIAVKTVENTQSRLFRKLGVRNRAEALTVANRMGLLDAGAPPSPVEPIAPPAH